MWRDLLWLPSDQPDLLSSFSSNMQTTDSADVWYGCWKSSVNMYIILEDNLSHAFFFFFSLSGIVAYCGSQRAENHSSWRFASGRTLEVQCAEWSDIYRFKAHIVTKWIKDGCSTSKMHIEKCWPISGSCLVCSFWATVVTWCDMDCFFQYKLLILMQCKHSSFHSLQKET